MNSARPASGIITDAVGEDAKIIFGMVHDPLITEGEMRVTVVVIGFEKPAP